MENVYAFDEINQRLNELGNDGWELLHAEPHWIWGNMTYGAPLWFIALNNNRRKVEAAASYPEYIVGWYCTFKREKQQQNGKMSGFQTEKSNYKPFSFEHQNR